MHLVLQSPRSASCSRSGGLEPAVSVHRDARLRSLRLTLQDIDVVQLEALQAGLDRIEYMLGTNKVNKRLFCNISYGSHLAVETALVDNPVLFRVERDMQAGVICDREKDLCGVSPRASLRHRRSQEIAYLRHDDELLAREVELLNCLSEDHL